MNIRTQKIQALEKAIQLAGGQETLAQRIEEAGFKCSQSKISLWKNRNQEVTPPWAAPVIERILAGAVTCAELRPDIWPVK